MKLLAEKNLKKNIEPIIHVIADGQGYWIYNEDQVPSISSSQRLVVIAFPRPLKHHVLLHAIFGHELGHTAIRTAVAGNVLQIDVMGALATKGHMVNAATTKAWLNDATAPKEITSALEDCDHQLWIEEIVCDLFGLLLFGPGFFAAHRTYLLPISSNAYNFCQTHPPYAVRHKMLIRTMRLLGWEKTRTDTSHGEFHQAEDKFLKTILEDKFNDWADVFDDTQLNDAIAGVRKIFTNCGTLGYEPIDADRLVHLVGRLKNGLPPIIAEIEPDGTPKLEKVEISQTLYAGWVYWAGREHLKTAEGETLDFFKTNRLCDHALLQQSAINLALGEGGA